jgi:hypothetical protein
LKEKRMKMNKKEAERKRLKMKNKEAERKEAEDE